MGIERSGAGFAYFVVPKMGQMRLTALKLRLWVPFWEKRA
jgi:hypothetical protein